MKCKTCIEKDVIKYSKWSSGDFCSKECARAYSTKNKRQEINKKVSKTLINRYKNNELSHDRGFKSGSKSALKMSNSLKKYHRKTKEKLKQKLPFEQWKIPWIKEFLFKKIGNRCENKKCKYEYTDPNTGKGPFQIHHKDGNKKNWKRNNLQILCMNCHWKTSNWGFRNKTHKKESIEKGLKTSIKNGRIKNIKSEKYKHILIGVV